MANELIAVDLGTTHVRVGVYDAAGAHRPLARRALGVDTDPQGRAEQDAEAVWRAVRELLADTLRAAGAREPLALSLSTQGDAVIPVDSQGNALHPAILGMDYRSRPQAAALARWPGARRLHRATGIRPHPIAALCKILWLREERPEVADHAWRFETYGDYLLGKLGARPVMDRTMASRTMAYDLRRDDWSPGVMRRVGLDPERLSPVVDPGRPVGTLAPDLVREMGLARAPLLVAGAHDQVCAALGCGVPAHGTCVISTGSAEVLSVALTRKRLGAAMYRASYPCYRFACPGMYFTFSLNHAAGVLLEWLRETLGVATSDFRGLGRGPSPVLVLPHWNGAGTPRSDPLSRGAILGLGLATTRADIALAVLESLSYELALNVESLTAAGIPLPDLTATGGGAAEREWVQLKADILDRPIRIAPDPEAAALGAAMLAAHGAGLYPTVRSAAQTMARRGDLVEPRPDRVRAHRERLGLYRGLYERLRPITRSLP